MEIEKLPVKVRLRAEPENEKDKNAIAIDMDHDTGWFPVRYSASELTADLHPLILEGKILETCEAYCFHSSFCSHWFFSFNSDGMEWEVGEITDLRFLIKSS